MITLTDRDITELMKKNSMDEAALNEAVVNELKSKRLRVATAESCTGGLLSQRITSVSGASGVFECGVCSYSNDIKHKLLGVDEEILTVLGAVSSETAMQMAEGVRKLADSDLAVSTTGIAGPTGGTPEKPVGLVFCGVSTRSKSYALKLMLGGSSEHPNSRDRIRRLTVNAVLLTLLSLIK